MKIKINKVLLTVFFMLFAFMLFAQKEPPKPGAGAPPPPPGLPIDGGLSFLIVSGVAFGVYKLRKKN